jgi:hypothetical protein
MTAAIPGRLGIAAMLDGLVQFVTKGEGGGPEQALSDLANKLKPIQGDPNG